MQGTWRDAEDGYLEANAIAQGSVDSTYALSTRIAPGRESTLYAWIAVGRSLEEVRTLNGLIGFEGPEALITRTRAFWQLWLKRRAADRLEAEPFQDLYNRSLLLVRTNCDRMGGIVAANDSDIMDSSRDTYSYVWPRDGAFVARALDSAGYPNLSGRFFDFMAPLIDPGGYYLHKYNPDGSLASSWHPWVVGGRPELPIQEDETGTMLWAMWEHFADFRDVERAEAWLESVVLPAGQFLADYRHPETGLPWPSWDLWEERRGIHAYTTASVWAGLMAAGHFARAFGYEDRANTFYQAAHEIRTAALTHLVDPDTSRLYRSLLIDEQHPENLTADPTPDASLLLIPQFGFLAPDHPVMGQTAQWIRESLAVPSDVGGLARYRGDHYHRAPHLGPEVPGNPWFICTLWLADYLLMRARTPDDLARPREIIEWVQHHAPKSGVLAEQLDPTTGAPLSVAPLTWSHSALIATIGRYRETLARMRDGSRQDAAREMPSIGY
ncbi:glycoside hydrolase family 15 protein [Sulfobacillus harzensis]|uniref:Glycoside hydrolase family 15 protein n=1 Tax=Sulfobacillus harzensis TaxID=2729629 RepID=A0A7Y0Q413_9FIRM|nr:glycoside hydrolase family 15 protein [Sulfobacillus harzensis]NMP24137.1 glycoside hydrolase family 15 protein [Sulfobacillus harzensis]